MTTFVAAGKDLRAFDVLAGTSGGASVDAERIAQLYLGFFEFVHNVRKRGKALLGSLIELLVAKDPGSQ